MNLLKRLAEWYLDVPSASAGEETVWKLTTNGSLPIWVIPVAAGVILAVIFRVYLRETLTLKRPVRFALITLRCTAVGLLLILIARPVLSVAREHQSWVAVLIDSSASMGLADEYGASAQASAVAELIGRTDRHAAERIRIVQELLTRHDARFLRRLARRHRIDVYEFSSDAALAAAWDDTSDDAVADLAAQVGHLAAQGDATRPARALLSVIDDYATRPLAGIVLISDGVTTTGSAERASAVAPYVSRRRIPVFVLGIGSLDPPRDLKLSDVFCSDAAIVGQPLRVSARISNQGFSGTNARARLIDSESERVLVEQITAIPEDGAELQMHFEFIPDAVGNRRLRVEVDADVRELNRENNQATHRVFVHRRGLKVLLADGSPRWEFRALRHLFGRLPDPETSIELHTCLQDADWSTNARTASDVHQLVRFPSDIDELSQYHVIIVGDLAPESMGPKAMLGLSEFVSDLAGGLILIAGTDHNPVAFAATEMEPLLPLRLSSTALPRGGHDPGLIFRVVPTIIGRDTTELFTPMVAGLTAPRANHVLPPLHWLVRATELTRTATVLANASISGEVEMEFPLVIRQQYGSGTVVFHATDETWRWRREAGEAIFAHYWLQMIRDLAGERLRASGLSAELSTDQLQYQVGDTVNVRLRRFQPKSPIERGSLSVEIEHESGRRLTRELHAVPDARHVYRASFTAENPGRHRVTADDPIPGSDLPAAEFEVEVRDRERSQRGPDHDDLRRTARESGGRFYTIDRASRLAYGIRSRDSETPIQVTVVPLSSRWELPALLVLMLITEWILRRHCRLV